MLSAQTIRGKFRDGAVETASKERVVVMAFDRLDRDLAESLQAIEAGQGDQANTALTHAQALLAELQHMLDLDVWEHARGLSLLYDYMIRRLVAGNIMKDAEPVAEVQGMVRELGDAFRAAAREVLAAHAAQNAAAAAALSRVG